MIFNSLDARQDERLCTAKPLDFNHNMFSTQNIHKTRLMSLTVTHWRDRVTVVVEDDGGDDSCSGIRLRSVCRFQKESINCALIEGVNCALIESLIVSFMSDNICGIF